MSHPSALGIDFIEIRSILMISSLEQVFTCGKTYSSGELPEKVFQIANNDVTHFIRKEGPIYSKIPTDIYPADVYRSEQIMSMNNKKVYNPKSWYEKTKKCKKRLQYLTAKWVNFLDSFNERQGNYSSGINLLDRITEFERIIWKEGK